MKNTINNVVVYTTIVIEVELKGNNCSCLSFERILIKTKQPLIKNAPAKVAGAKLYFKLTGLLISRILNQLIVLIHFINLYRREIQFVIP